VLKTGASTLTLWSLLYLLILFVLLFYVSNRIRHLLTKRLLVRSKLDAGVRESVGAILRYLILVLGFFVILQTAGIDLTALSILAGAVGIGIGFGLQNIANNFISGLIILFERPIKIGDKNRGGQYRRGCGVDRRPRYHGHYQRQHRRDCSKLQFISQNVINWSHTDRKVRFKISVNVSYGSNPRLVEKLLLEVAEQSPDVLKDPAPGVRLLAFGDNGLQFELRAWSSSLLHRKGRLVSNLNFGIYDKFTANGIEFPFPQRDIHLRSLPPGFKSYPDQ